MATRPRRVGLLHYTCPPVIGGVETILYEQARRLAARGHSITVISGRGGPLPASDDVRLVIVPELDSRDPHVTAVRERLLDGQVPADYAGLRDHIQQ
ncbi:MAG TPA: glycosyltransferase, partial [Candidatus Dormibacteraeota bacterium]